MYPSLVYIPIPMRTALLKSSRLLMLVKMQGYPVLVFPKGRYDIWPENAIRKEYFIQYFYGKGMSFKNKNHRIIIRKYTSFTGGGIWSAVDVPW